MLNQINQLNMVKGTDFDLKDPKLVDYLDKNHTELRFPRWSAAIGEDLVNAHAEPGIRRLISAPLSLQPGTLVALFVSVSSRSMVKTRAKEQ